MFIGATNITLIYFFFNGKPKKLFTDEETRWFFWFVLIITAMSTAWIMYKGIVDDLGTAFREAVFQVVTLVSTVLLAVGTGSDGGMRLRGFYLRRVEDGTFCDPNQEPLQ